MNRLTIRENGTSGISDAELVAAVEQYVADCGDRLKRLLLIVPDYAGRVETICNVDENEDLRNNLSAAAHLIHGSSDNRFAITYCTKMLSRAEVEGVHFSYHSYDEAAALYDVASLRSGYNTLPNGDEIYYIPNPALGLWADRSKF